MVLALVDDFSPTAAEEREGVVRVFFTDRVDRDAARFAVASRFPAAAIEVSDEDWARRSQDNLQPITIGRLTIIPNPELLIPDPAFLVPTPDSRIPNPDSRIPTPASRGIPAPDSLIANADTVVIVPSMGFGTGHHATTRLCLEALQSIDLADACVLDVGTGSGILAIAAVRLGAARAVGIDNDADAIEAAQANLALNDPPPSTPQSAPDTRQALSTQHRAPDTRHGALDTRHAALDTRHAPSTQHTAPSTRVAFALSDLRAYLTSHRDTIDVVTANLTGALLIRTAAEIQAAVRSGGTIIVSGVLNDEREDVVRAFESTPVVQERSEDEWVCLTMKKP
jgi:ribosomal protein L11 methyltransferase